ncbi:MAG: hypothetical protein HQK79_12730 [Desulfobacterales bacterium]|nr:hypothetical protein [Desulfobacterales bacterium]
MTDFGDNEIICQNFLIELYKRTKGNTSLKMSMFDIGDDLGLEKSYTSRVAETLIGNGLIDIRTLSGGIGLTSEGLNFINEKTGMSNDTQSCIKLCDEPVLIEVQIQAVKKVIDDLNQQAGSLGLNYSSLIELTADIKTADSQLTSSKPKTDIIRACLISIQNILKEHNKTNNFETIKLLIGK